MPARYWQSGKSPSRQILKYLKSKIDEIEVTRDELEHGMMCRAKRCRAKFERGAVQSKTVQSETVHETVASRERER